ncbi:MAG: DUF2892 domain-containing protein [Candidatus Micrarchaeia archaeon]
MKITQIRDIGRGLLILLGAFLAYSGNVTIGIAFAAFVALMMIQGAFTGFCILDMIYKAIGAKD